MKRGGRTEKARRTRQRKQKEGKMNDSARIKKNER